MSDSRIGRRGQIKVYTGKCFRTFFNEKGWKTLISTLIIAVILAWVIGKKTFVIRESTQYGLFAMICGCLWTGLFNSIQSICRERAIIKREHRTGLHISSYVFAHLIFEFILCAVEALIMTIVFGIFRGFPAHGVVFPAACIDFYFGFLFVIFASDALGILVSCIVKSENAAMTVMPFVLIVQLVMSGMMFTLPKSAEFVKEFTVSKWGLTALCSSADTNSLPSTAALVKKLNNYIGEGGTINASPTELQQALEEYQSGKLGYEPDYEATSGNVLAGWGVLLGYTVLYTAIGILFLKRVDKDRR